MLILMPLIVVIGYLMNYKLGVFQTRLNDLVKNEELLAEAKVIDNLVHQLQRERGFSAGFIASSGEVFSEQLDTQRAGTDQAVLELKTGLKKTLRLKADLSSTAYDTLTNLSVWHAEVSSVTSAVPVMADRYTGLINTLIGLSASESIGGKDNDLRNVDRLLQAKN